MKLAIVGAGWAGLAAAVAAAESGAVVTLFEAGRVAGGRARSVAADDFSFCDNGQHLLIAAYDGVRDLLRRVGAQVDWVREPMYWHLADGVQFQAACLPKPLNVLGGLCGAKGVAVAEKAALMADLVALLWWRRWGGADKSVAAFLRERGVSAKWRDDFWQAMVWGALNTPVETASLRVLANVLQVGGGSDFCFPIKGLGEFVVQPALARLAALGGTFVPETRVGRLQVQDNQILVENQLFDKVIVAVAPYHLAGVLPEKWGDDFQAALQGANYHAITTVYLRYAEKPQLPVLMTGLAHGTAQWLIDRSRLNGANEVAAVISVSEQHGSLKTAEWAARVHEDVRRVSSNVGEPIATKVITEKRATMATAVGRVIPNQTLLNQKGIFVAGDYLHEDYPATLEAAVLSGFAAAKGCLAG